MGQHAPELGQIVLEQRPETVEHGAVGVIGEAHGRVGHGPPPKISDPGHEKSLPGGRHVRIRKA